MATAAEKRATVEAVRKDLASGIREEAACRARGISRATFRRWAARLDAGLTLDDGKSSGRPSLASGLTDDEAAELRRRYVKSNLRDGAGSMTYAARSAARDPDSCLRPETRAAILAPRSSKHKIPVAIRRAVRASDAAVRFYRNPDDQRLGGVATRGYLRMALDEATGQMRRLLAGERQSWDNASVNFPVAVPWPWGGDKCSDRWGCRVARFQLLLGIDDATDHCVGWSYVCRMQDSYRAEDVVRTVSHAWRTGYVPDSVVFEGGAWQAARTLRFLDLAGVRLVSAKGRPRQKLIENYIGRLWTPLSEFGGPSIGRFRGEMKRESDELMRCQRGAQDPRLVFCSLETALDAIQRGIDYIEAEQVESAEYGRWVPAQAHAEQIAMKAGLRTMPADIAWLAAPEVHERKIRHHGMVAAKAVSPLGHARTYVFASDAAQAFEGAAVRIWFDPHESPVSACIELAQPFRDTPAGTIIERHALAVNAAPEVIRDEAAGRWVVRFGGGIDSAAMMRRASVAAVRRELRGVGLDGRRLAGVSEVRAAGAVSTAAGIVPAASLPVAPAPAMPDVSDKDLEELERAAGLVAGVA